MAAEVISIVPIIRDRQLRDKLRMPSYGELLEELEVLNAKYTKVLEENLELMHRLEELS